MTEHHGLPVAGYTKQSDHKVTFVNVNKQMEERLLRRLEEMHEDGYDARWIAVAKTHFEQGFMAMNRAVFRPERISLPEDK